MVRFTALALPRSILQAGLAETGHGTVLVPEAGVFRSNGTVSAGVGTVFSERRVGGAECTWGRDGEGRSGCGDASG